MHGVIVAPRAGAWIEIATNPASMTDIRVAPRAGAWIEMLPSACHRGVRRMSPLAQGRGLKCCR